MSPPLQTHAELSGKQGFKTVFKSLQQATTCSPGAEEERFEAEQVNERRHVEPE